MATATSTSHSNKNQPSSEQSPPVVGEELAPAVVALEAVHEQPEQESLQQSLPAESNGSSQPLAPHEITSSLDDYFFNEDTRQEEAVDEMDGGPLMVDDEESDEGGEENNQSNRFVPDSTDRFEQNKTITFSTHDNYDSDVHPLFRSSSSSNNNNHDQNNHLPAGWESKVQLGTELYHNRQPSTIFEEPSSFLTSITSATTTTANRSSLTPEEVPPKVSVQAPITNSRVADPHQASHVQDDEDEEEYNGLDDTLLPSAKDPVSPTLLTAVSSSSSLLERSYGTSVNQMDQRGATPVSSSATVTPSVPLVSNLRCTTPRHERLSPPRLNHSTVEPKASTPSSSLLSKLLGSSSSGSARCGSTMSRDKKNAIFTPFYTSTWFLEQLSRRLLKRDYSPHAAATWIGFWALLHVTCANYVLTPMRDAIALQVGVKHIPILTLVSTVLAFVSSVPIGWLFEAPDPNRRRLWKRMGLTRGETQGTSLALFFRCFALCLLSYAVGFSLVEWLASTATKDAKGMNGASESIGAAAAVAAASGARALQDALQPVLVAERSRWLLSDLQVVWQTLGKILYVAFFLVVHLMKLHSLSLVWGVTTEAMEYEEVARKKSQMDSNKTRLQRLALVGFGGTIGGILGSGLASTMAQLLRLPGLLVMSAFLLEISAELSIELGRIMKKHWEEQQLFQSSNDLTSLDTSMKRSASLGSMKRVASGNSLYRTQSTSELNRSTSSSSLSNGATSKSSSTQQEPPEDMNDNTFTQRLLRGVTTILRSRLLMAIFTYNALYASTTVLLSFQRAELVANRSDKSTTEADTAFLANVNMASSIAIFALQATGAGAHLAHACGPRGTLALMPLIRLLGVLALAWWHHTSNGQQPNLLIFLFVDECTKIMNLAVAKPVRESLWRGLSNEARYEAKPIVDTIANRWGGGSAAFLVSFLNRLLGVLGVQAGPSGVRNVFGFPPILFLCMIIAAWWAAVSADLGQIRKRIDLELKKRQ